MANLSLRMADLRSFGAFMTRRVGGLGLSGTIDQLEMKGIIMSRLRVLEYLQTVCNKTPGLKIHSPFADCRWPE